MEIPGWRRNLGSDPGQHKFCLCNKSSCSGLKEAISILYAGVASGLYEGQQHLSLPTNGLYRSSDGGNTWQQVLPNITGHNVPYAVEDITIAGDSSRIYIGTRPNLDGEWRQPPYCTPRQWSARFLDGQ